MPRENRVPIMMSDTELTGIDDWRFRKRVATRSDAIRRLCQIGLTHEREAERISKSSEKALRMFFHAIKRLEGTPSEKRAKSAYLHLLALQDAQIQLNRDIAKAFLTEEILGSREAEIGAAMKIAQQFRELIDEEVKRSEADAPKARQEVGGRQRKGVQQRRRKA